MLFTKGPVIHTPCSRKSDTYRSFLRRGPSKCEGVCEIPLWEDQPASPSALLHWWSDRGALPWPRLHTDRWKTSADSEIQVHLFLFTSFAKD